MVEMKSFVLIPVHMSFMPAPIIVFPQNKLDLESVRDETEVTITKYVLDGTEAVHTLGFVISTILMARH